MDTLHEEIDERIAKGFLAELPDNDNYRPGDQYRKYREVYDSYYQEVRSEFYRKGCGAMWAFRGVAEGESPSWCVKREEKLGTTMAMGALIDLMGDDLDGIASMMDDAQVMGLLD
jgi:hypothetical protein